MNNIITVSDNAIRQIKKIIADASSKVDGVIVDVDKTGVDTLIELIMQKTQIH